MKTKKIISFFGILVLSCIITSCHSSKENNKNYRQKQQVLKINIVTEPQSLDPRKVRNLTDINLVKMFHDGLVRTEKNDAYSLALAESIVKSQDGKTYTIKLKDAFWSNGDKITSYDFAYSFKESLSPNFHSEYAYQLFVIRNAKAVKEGNLPSSLLGITCIDDKTFTISLEKPVPFFEKVLALPVCFPVNEKVDRASPNWSRSVDQYVASGPFILTAWSHQDKIVAQKNKKYWDSNSVQLKEIEMIMVNENTELNMFEQEDLNWSGSPFSIIPLDAIQSLQEESKLQTEPALGTYWIRTNIEHDLLKNVNIRKALALAINRKEIADHIMLGTQTPTTGIVPVTMDLQEAPYFTDGDNQAAVSFFETGLAESGYTKEDFSQLKLIFAPQERAKRVVEAIQQQWFEVLGISIQLHALEPKVYFDTIARKNYDLSYGSWVADFNDSVNFLDVFKTKNTGTNNTNWESLNYCKAINDSFYATSQKDRAQYLKAAEEIIIEDMPVIPLFNLKWVYTKDPTLKNINVTKEGYLDFKYASLE
ncbi:MAG: peptide ABC transporter substrate-binding protein [Chlamydiales bacterium]|nr:peptide ABC transporter substrate-binding protein [Chlamydiales bacterium]